MRFLLDGMLGRLARWLRILGYDTIYSANIQDDDLLAMASKENRILVTRDKDLYRRAILNNIECQLLANVGLSDWLESLMKKYRIKLDLETVQPRCSLCNTLLAASGRKGLTNDIPKAVRERYEQFWRCPSCNKVYWQGSHWQNMKEQLEVVTSQGLLPCD